METKGITGRDQRGSMMVELCAVCILMALFFLFMGEMALYIRDVIHVQQVAREGAREASLISSSPRFSNPEAMGRDRAEDCMKQYFGSGYGGHVEVTCAQGSFVCDVEFRHRVFCMPGASKLIQSRAVYPDFSE